MKKLQSLFAFLLISAVAFAGGPGDPKKESLKIGDKYPNAKQQLFAASGNESTTLDNLKRENGLLVIFSCNTCPFVVAWEDRYNKIHEVAKRNNVGMVLVNSNQAKRDGDDSRQAMHQHAKELGYTMPYLVDENSELANAFGAKTTPHVFLFDKNGKW